MVSNEILPEQSMKKKKSRPFGHQDFPWGQKANLKWAGPEMRRLANLVRQSKQ